MNVTLEEITSWSIDQIIDRVEDFLLAHLPCRIRFKNQPQNTHSPGPDEHTGIWFGCRNGYDLEINDEINEKKMKTSRKPARKSTKRLFRYGIYYRDPCGEVLDRQILTPESRVFGTKQLVKFQHIEKIEDRPWKVFEGLPFCLTCYFNWDVNGNTGSFVCFIFLHVFLHSLFFSDI